MGAGDTPWHGQAAQPGSSSFPRGSAQPTWLLPGVRQNPSIPWARHGRRPPRGANGKAKERGRTALGQAAARMSPAARPAGSTPWRRESHGLPSGAARAGQESPLGWAT